MPTVPVTKMHGTQNDFVLIDERTARLADYPQMARIICDRHTGVGADGLLVILTSLSADVQMRIWNADGGEAEMCGNGVRCVARFLHEAGSRDELGIQTAAGTIDTQIISAVPDYTVRVRVGVPKFERRENAADNVAFVVVGNPHLVIFVSGLDDVDLDAEGTRYNALIPGGTNVHVATKAGPSRMLVRHWERGVGRTMACGTGAVAVAAAAIQRGDVKSPVEVNVPGGRLIVEWDGTGDAYLTGPAVRVFDADFKIPKTLLAAAP